MQAATASAVEHDNAHKGDPRPIIVLDPGHGGIDNGAVAGSGAMEKDIVLEFATQLRDQLERSGKYRVVMTRTDDTFIPLVDRVRMARIRQAALFVSIHADAHREGRGRGAGGDGLHAVGDRLRRRGGAVSPKPRTAPTSSPASTCRMSPATSPTS